MVNDKSVPVTCLSSCPSHPAGCRLVEEVARRRRRSRQRSPRAAEEPATTPACQICVCASVFRACVQRNCKVKPYLTGQCCALGTSTQTEQCFSRAHSARRQSSNLRSLDPTFTLFNVDTNEKIDAQVADLLGVLRVRLPARPKKWQKKYSKELERSSTKKCHREVPQRSAIEKCHKEVPQRSDTKNATEKCHREVPQRT